MASKRLIATVLIRNGVTVKSYGYRFWRPAGSLATALVNLDRWAVDEILLLDVSRRSVIQPETLAEIRKAKISTPLIYGGGIRTPNDVMRLLEVGVDRFVVESLINQRTDSLREIADIVGKQAILGSLPVIWDGAAFRAWTSSGSVDLDVAMSRLYEAPLSEVLIIDADNEGHYGKFSQGLKDTVLQITQSRESRGLIWFGGLNERIAAELLLHQTTVGVAIGNINFEREIFLSAFRKNLHKGGFNAPVRDAKAF